MDIRELLTTLIAGIGLVTGMVGYYGKARGDSIILYQAKENAALKDYNTTLEADKVALIAKVDSLQRENSTLKELAQGSPTLTKLAVEMKNLTKAVTVQTTSFMKESTRRNL